MYLLTLDIIVSIIIFILILSVKVKTLKRDVTAVNININTSKSLAQGHAWDSGTRQAFCQLDNVVKSGAGEVFFGLCSVRLNK